MIEFDGCDDCLEVLINYVNGEPMTDHQTGWVIPNMTDQHPELKESFGGIRVDDSSVHFSHATCGGCGSPVSGNRRDIRVYT